MLSEVDLRRIVPDRIRQLPRDHVGHPVLFFAQRNAHGLVDYHNVRPGAVEQVLEHDLCYICGQHLGRNKAFLTGPVGALRATALEPPSHRSCAMYAARACKYFIKPRLRPEALVVNNTTCVWITRTFTPVPIDNRLQFHIGKPVEVTWFRLGEIATHDEVVRSVQSALYVMLDIARDESQDAVNALIYAAHKLRQYLPPEGGNVGSQPGAKANTEGRAEGGGCEPRAAAADRG